mmetsp:Transcript_21686/g.56610  ORF Transcript_21686/g.56610 Transcript_21686/m.56610 type:complete len:273 (-) Transcript_21686:721-1539(-)
MSGCLRVELAKSRHMPDADLKLDITRACAVLNERERELGLLAVIREALHLREGSRLRNALARAVKVLPYGPKTESELAVVLADAEAAIGCKARHVDAILEATLGNSIRPHLDDFSKAESAAFDCLAAQPDPTVPCGCSDVTEHEPVSIARSRAIAIETALVESESTMADIVRAQREKIAFIHAERENVQAELSQQSLRVSEADTAVTRAHEHLEQIKAQLVAAQEATASAIAARDEKVRVRTEIESALNEKEAQLVDERADAELYTSAVRNE